MKPHKLRGLLRNTSLVTISHFQADWLMIFPSIAGVSLFLDKALLQIPFPL